MRCEKPCRTYAQVLSIQQHKSCRVSPWIVRMTQLCGYRDALAILRSTIPPSLTLSFDPVHTWRSLKAAWRSGRGERTSIYRCSSARVATPPFLWFAPPRSWPGACPARPLIHLLSPCVAARIVVGATRTAGVKGHCIPRARRRWRPQRPSRARPPTRLRMRRLQEPL